MLPFVSRCFLSRRRDLIYAIIYYTLCRLIPVDDAASLILRKYTTVRRSTRQPETLGDLIMHVNTEHTSCSHHAFQYKVGTSMRSLAGSRNDNGKTIDDDVMKNHTQFTCNS